MMMMMMMMPNVGNTHSLRLDRSCEKVTTKFMESFLVIFITIYTLKGRYSLFDEHSDREREIKKEDYGIFW